MNLFTSFSNHLQNGVYRAFEPQEITQLRTQLEVGAKLARQISLVTTVVSALLAVLALVHGWCTAIFFTPLLTVISLISFDFYNIAKEAESLSKEPRHFGFLQEGNREAALKGFFDFIEKLVKNTLFCNVIFQTVKTVNQNRVHQVQV